jgi:redox-sensing transcriptional repressor
LPFLDFHPRAPRHRRRITAQPVMAGGRVFTMDADGVVAAFDANPDSARTRVVSIPVFPESDLDSFVREHSIKLAILCVPAEFAQAVVNRLVAVGVQGILNFSPLLLEVPADVTVNNVDLALELEHLSYFIR